MAGVSSISGAAHSLSLFAHLDDLAKNDPKIEQNGSLTQSPTLPGSERSLRRGLSRCRLQDAVDGSDADVGEDSVDAGLKPSHWS